MMTVRSLLFLSVFFFIQPRIALAQQQPDPKTDSSRSQGRIHSLVDYFFHQERSLYGDPVFDDAARYERHRGKIIRRITIRNLNFRSPFEEAEQSNSLIEEGRHFLDRLHTKTKDDVIYRNLFIRENQVIDPDLIADNERFLRTIEFVQDVRIQVRSTESQDSVDLVVFIKDIFEYTGTFGGVSTTRQKLGIANININGEGQEIGINVLHDVLRSPSMGLEGHYKYQNLFGSFIDLEARSSLIEENLYDLNEDQFVLSLELTRPLISRFSRFAGGLKLATEISQNLYPDLYHTGIYSYRAGVADVWLGYNFIGRRSEHRLGIQKFVALRYFTKRFFEIPAQVQENELDARFNRHTGFLASFTLFQQLFYKDRFIYGFGVTEDFPIGFNVSGVFGMYRQLTLRRPYLGFNYYRHYVTKGKDLGQFFLRTGAFYNRGFEDVGLLVGSSLYLRLREYRQIHIRHYFRFNYSALVNRKAMEPLHLNNTFGLYGFESAYAKGNQRLSLRMENYYFLPIRLIGFQLAPITIVDLSWLQSRRSDTEKGFFVAFGAGLRVRNENLGFNTLEVRASFLPRRLPGDNHINFLFRTDIRFKERNYVNKPALLELNSDLDHLLL